MFFSWPRLSLATVAYHFFIAARACMNLRNFSAILVSRVPKGPQQRVPHLDSNRHQAKQTISSTIKAGKETVPIWCILSKGASFFFLVFTLRWIVDRLLESSLRLRRRTTNAKLNMISFARFFCKYLFF